MADAPVMVPEWSNVVAVWQNVTIQNGSSFNEYIQLPQKDGTLVDFANVLDVRMEIESPGSNGGKIQAIYKIGNGFRIDETDSKRLIWYKMPDEKNIKPGVYVYDIKVLFTQFEAQILKKGNYISVYSVTN